MRTTGAWAGSSTCSMSRIVKQLWLLRNEAPLRPLCEFACQLAVACNGARRVLLDAPGVDRNERLAAHRRRHGTFRRRNHTDRSLPGDFASVALGVRRQCLRVQGIAWISSITGQTCADRSHHLQSTCELQRTNAGRELPVRRSSDDHDRRPRRRDSMTHRVFLSRRGLLRVGLTSGVVAASSGLSLTTVHRAQPEVGAQHPRLLIRPGSHRR
jgi:hypothetical protein